jgi:hypothetical protein
MSDIEGKVAGEAMSECGQRASFNAFGVADVCTAKEATMHERAAACLAVAHAKAGRGRRVTREKV